MAFFYLKLYYLKQNLDASSSLPSSNKLKLQFGDESNFNFFDSNLNNDNLDFDEQEKAQSLKEPFLKKRQSIFISFIHSKKKSIIL